VASFSSGNNKSGPGFRFRPESLEGVAQVVNLPPRPLVLALETQPKPGVRSLLHEHLEHLETRLFHRQGGPELVDE
jgi:hypothetical protein